ncbi:hypothetical protein CERSUDRAFT_26882, partial [Gelatoporia subvermispora B]
YTVLGVVSRDENSNSRVIGKWFINGRYFALTCNLSNSVPTFTTSRASLKYYNVDDLTGTRTFQGLIGPTQITLTLDNHVTVSGVLDYPIDVNASVNGTG